LKPSGLAILSLKTYPDCWVLKKGYEANGMDTSYLRVALERAVYHVQHQEQEEDEDFEEDVEETDDF